MIHDVVLTKMYQSSIDLCWSLSQRHGAKVKLFRGETNKNKMVTFVSNIMGQRKRFDISQDVYKSCQKRGGLCIRHKAKCVPRKKCSVRCECNLWLFEGVEFVLPMVLKSETEKKRCSYQLRPRAHKKQKQGLRRECSVQIRRWEKNNEEEEERDNCF